MGILILSTPVSQASVIRVAKGGRYVRDAGSRMSSNRDGSVIDETVERD
ncbi:hypothetical protein P0L94_18410 [Microbacter sp. GSS18]|nr:hypothetical protein P0L94_18410 [Microbacter sp. GSS18]